METLTGWLATGAPVRVIDASKPTDDPPSSVCNGSEG